MPESLATRWGWMSTPAGLNNGCRDGVMPATRAQGGNLALIVASGVADFVLPGWGGATGVWPDRSMPRLCLRCGRQAPAAPATGYRLSDKARRDGVPSAPYRHQLLWRHPQLLISKLRICASRFCSTTNTRSCINEFVHRLREREGTQTQRVQRQSLSCQHVQRPAMAGLVEP